MGAMTKIATTIRYLICAAIIGRSANPVIWQRIDFKFGNKKSRTPFAKCAGLIALPIARLGAGGSRLDLARATATHEIHDCQQDQGADE